MAPSSTGRSARTARGTSRRRTTSRSSGGRLRWAAWTSARSISIAIRRAKRCPTLRRTTRTIPCGRTRSSCMPGAHRRSRRRHGQPGDQLGGQRRIRARSLQAFGALTPTGEVIADAQGPDNAGPFPRRRSPGPRRRPDLVRCRRPALFRHRRLSQRHDFGSVDLRLLPPPHRRPRQARVDRLGYLYGRTDEYVSRQHGRLQRHALPRDVEARHGHAARLGGKHPPLDINERNFDTTPNPDVGRAYIAARSGSMGSFSNKSDRDAYRLQGFVAYDFAERHEGVGANCSASSALPRSTRRRARSSTVATCSLRAGIRRRSRSSDRTRRSRTRTSTPASVIT